MAVHSRPQTTVLLRPSKSAAAPEGISQITEILFVSEPTRGIDVGAKKLVLDTLRRVNRENGTTIIMTSSELEELRSICDRIAIINEGRVSGILPASAEAEEFGLLMLGHVEEQTAAANQ